MGKNVKFITVSWLLVAFILSFLYYRFSSLGVKDPKVILIITEFLLTFLIAYWFLRKDIQEVTDSSKLSSIYSSTSRDPSNLTNLILIVTMIIFSFIAIIPIVYCIKCINNGSLKIELVLKTAISIVLAYGCAMSFGKITLGYAKDILREVSVELAECKKNTNFSKEYEVR